jgi:hypothetical protein
MKKRCETYVETISKCSFCQQVFGKQRYLGKFSAVDVFCSEGCRNKNDLEVQEKMSDNDETEFHL